MKFPHIRCVLMACLLLTTQVRADALTIQEAIQFARKDDPKVAWLNTQSEALKEDAIADNQLPDPKLKLATFAVPIDFKYRKEPMNQFQVGIQQAFPRKGSLLHKQQQTLAKADEKKVMTRDIYRKIDLAVEQAYLDLVYPLEALKIIQKSRGLFATMLEITKIHFASGTQTQQAVIEAKLELSQLDDREIQLEEIADKARANLAKWIGKMAYRPIQTKEINLPPLLTLVEIEKRLIDHPQIQIIESQLNTQKAKVALAEDQYNPAWMLDVTYSKRLSYNIKGRTKDFVSAMVLVDLPFFTDKRQDRRLSAEKARVLAKRYQRTDQVRELKRQLHNKYSRWQRLMEREKLFKKTLIPENEENAAVAMQAYQNQVADFTTIIRAQLKRLETHLKALKIRVDQLKIQTELLYLQGDA